MVLYTKITSFSCKCMTVIYWYSRLHRPLISVRVFMLTGVVYPMCLGTHFCFLLAVILCSRWSMFSNHGHIICMPMIWTLCKSNSFLVSFDNLSAIYWQYRLQASAFPQIIISLSHCLPVIICTTIIIQVLVLFYIIVVGMIVTVYLWDGLSVCISTRCL